MRARNISHRLVVVFTFAVGVAAALLWTGAHRKDKPAPEPFEVTSVLTPARELSYRDVTDAQQENFSPQQHTPEN